MRSTKRIRRTDEAISQRLKELRAGELDADIFRMMGQDVPLCIIARRLAVYPSYLAIHVNRVFKAFREPDDAVKPFPWQRGVLVK